MIFVTRQKKSANMADNRGMNFPGNQQPGNVPGYGMMTNMGVQFVPQGMQPVPNPMMQQQMMAPPGVMPQMYPMQMGVRTMAPPPYTPQMAQNFRMRTAAPRAPRPQKELSEKERQFQVQQQRLKQFGKPGAVTADADKLIANMFGAEKPKPRNTAKSQPQAMTEDDDSFGAFMQGPSLAPPASPQTPSPIQTQTMDNGQAASSAGQPAVSPRPEKKPKQEKKAPDLTAMMMECSDLKAPQKAKLFHKPSLKEVQVEHHSSLPVFHQSDHSRQWTRTDNLDGLFASEPAPVPTVAKTTKKRHSSGASKAVVAKTTSGLPVWCEAPDDQLPPLYRHVYEATLVEGKIDTGRVYPILLLSGLPRESLGTIWQLANKETPGQLIKSELYAILALVALTQNNFTINSAEILLRCPQPPVPFLGPQSVAMVTQPAVSQGAVSGQTGPAIPPTGVPSQALPPQAPPQVLPQGQSLPQTVPGQAPNSMPGQVQPQMMPPGPPQAPSGPQIPPTNQYPVPAVPQSGVPSPVIQQFPPQFISQGAIPSVGHQPSAPAPPTVVPIVSNSSGTQGGFSAAPNLQPPSSVPAVDDDFADFQAAAPASSSVKQEDNFGDFIGGAPAVIQPPMEEKPSYIFTVPKVDPELEVVSPDDKYNSNVRSFFCSSDSSTEASKHDSELKGQSTPSLDDEDFTDCRDSSQISTSEQSENEDIRAFESYVEEFHRKKEEREQNTQHRSLPTQTSRYSKPKVEPPQSIPSIPSIPPLSQAPKTGSNDFSDFKSAPSGGSAFTPVLSKGVYASQAAKAKQTVLTAAQRLASESDNEFTDFQEAPNPARDKRLHPVASESDLLGEEDRYNALRVLVGDDVPTSVFAQPKKEDEDFADFDAEGEEEEDWSGFTVAQTASESSEQVSLPNVQSVTSIGNASIMSLYGSERGEERAEDWADFEAATQANTEAQAPTDEWAAFPGTGSDVPEAVKESSDYSALSTGVGSETFGGNDAEDWGGFTDSSVGASDNTQQNNGNWSDFHTSSTTKQHSENILTVKKENLQTGEVLNVFKIKEENSNYKLSNKPTSTRLPSAESDFDDDRIPPPMDNMDDDDDHNTFSRGYDLDDMVRHTAVTTAYSMFASTSHHYSHTKHKNETKTTDSFRNNEERGHSLSPEMQQTETDSSSSKDMDSWGWKDKLQGVREDSQSVSSLEFPNGKGLSTQKDSDNGGTDSQSVSSMEFGTFESSSRVPLSGECKSVDSLELYKKEEGEVEGEEETQPDTQTAPMSGVPQSLFVGGEMRALADRYNIDGEVQGSNKHEYEWERCIDNCCRMIRDANTIFNSVSRSSVCNEVIKSAHGSEYVMGIIEIYRVSCRITAAITASGMKTTSLEKLIKDIDLAWNNLTAFFVGASVLPDPSTLNFYHAVMKSDSQMAQQRACGLCLLDVDAKSLAFKQDEEIAKLTYGGRQYHAPCANFWVNCVDSTLPALRLPELL